MSGRLVAVAWLAADGPAPLSWEFYTYREGAENETRDDDEGFSLPFEATAGMLEIVARVAFERYAADVVHVLDESAERIGEFGRGDV